jgi:hypothetical protein
MTRTEASLQHAALGLLIVNLVTIAVVLACLFAVRRASERGEDALVALADDVTRASQAQAAAERVIAVGRGYLLTQEPELLARAQAAEAKLGRTLRNIASRAPAGEERGRLEPVLASAKRYRDTFAALLSGENAPREPREIADALRRQLIPARDELVAGLDALAARRLVEVGELRAAAHTRRAIAVDLMLAVGLPGAGISVFLIWLLAVRTRTLIADRSGLIAATVRSSFGERSQPAGRLSRRAQSVGSRL